MGPPGELLPPPGCETRWLTGKCAGLESEKSGLKTWPCHHSLSLSITLNILFTSPQEYKWAPANFQGSLTKRRGGNLVIDWLLVQGEGK